MLMSYLITDQFTKDGMPTESKHSSYILENIELPREPQIGSLVCLIRDDGKGVYFRVNQVITYPHAPTSLTAARSDDWGILVQVILDYKDAKNDDLLHICVYANPYTPGRGIWKEVKNKQKAQAA